MGNEGGSIPTRRELVKKRKREETTSERFESKHLNHTDAWTTCRLSGKPLMQPIVSDYMGNLYNKESILEWLLDGGEGEGKTKFGPGQVGKVKHIKSLKDVVELDVATSASKDNSNNGSGRTWICPISQKDIVKESVNRAFVYVVGCGHVFTATALKEFENQCPVCEKPYNLEDEVVTLNPTSESDVSNLQQRMKRLESQGLSHSLKKNRKKHKKQKILYTIK